MANILIPDEVIAFLIANGYPDQYNDGLRAFLRIYYSLPDATLPDLFVRYITEVGLSLEDPLPPDPPGNRLWMEDGVSYILMEDNSFILLEDQT